MTPRQGGVIVRDRNKDPRVAGSSPTVFGLWGHKPQLTFSMVAHFPLIGSGVKLCLVLIDDTDRHLGRLFFFFLEGIHEEEAAFAFISFPHVCDPPGQQRSLGSSHPQCCGRHMDESKGRKAKPVVTSHFASLQSQVWDSPLQTYCYMCVYIKCL